MTNKEFLYLIAVALLFCFVSFWVGAVVFFIGYNMIEAWDYFYGYEPTSIR